MPQDDDRRESSALDGIARHGEILRECRIDRECRLLLQ